MLLSKIHVCQVMMPPGAAEVRASQKSILTGIVYDKVRVGFLHTGLNQGTALPIHGQNAQGKLAE